MTNAFDLQLDDHELRRALVKVLGKLSDSRPLMASIAHELLSATTEACHGSIFPDNFLSVPETYHDQESLITSSPRLQP